VRGEFEGEEVLDKEGEDEGEPERRKEGEKV
jgi:hypothetical protein